MGKPNDHGVEVHGADQDPSRSEVDHLQSHFIPIGGREAASGAPSGCEAAFKSLAWQRKSSTGVVMRLEGAHKMVIYKTWCTDGHHSNLCGVSNQISSMVAYIFLHHET